jgi:hypothetical protein
MLQLVRTVSPGYFRHCLKLRTWMRLSCALAALVIVATSALILCADAQELQPGSPVNQGPVIEKAKTPKQKIDPNAPLQQGGQGPILHANAAPPTPSLIPLPVSTNAGCLIQSDFGSGPHKNFETVVLQGADLVHYWRDNANVDYRWVRGQVITRSATGPGCIIQSSFRSGDHGNFEVVAPEGRNLVHYWHDNSNVRSAWRRGQVISTNVTGSDAIIQSSLRSGPHGNFEVVTIEGSNLVHYWHDNSDVRSPWRRGQVITSNASSPASLIQSSFRSGRHGNFEVAVREGANLVHYWRDNADVNTPWRRGQIISTSPGGPAALIQSSFRSSSHGNFELLTVENNRLVHYWRDNASVESPWRSGRIVAAPANGAVGFIQSDFRSGRHGNFEAVALSGDRVQHRWHDNANVESDWRPGQIVTPVTRSQKVCQLTGDFDFEHRNAAGNRTGARFAVPGTDLGSPFEHDGRLYIAFGDTAGDGRDSLAFTRSVDPDACPSLDFVADNGVFRPVGAGANVSLAYFEVPTTGFSVGDALYLFVWTNHRDLFRPDAEGRPTYSDPVGHAALLRSDDGGRSYRLIWDRISDQFVYLYSTVVNNADVPGLHPRTGRSLLLWGSGKMYRASNPYFAYIPLDQVENKDAMRFFAGAAQRIPLPIWVDASRKQQAQPLFDQPCIGEFSVTWNRNLEQWLMLYNCGAGILGRASNTPWGPWSEPAVFFDPATDAGFCHFIHRDDGCGPLNDPDAPEQGRPGGVYAPYVLSRFTRGGEQNTTIYYAMSTWNPYQVVLMRATLAAPHRFAYGPDTCKPGFVWREAVPDDHVCVAPGTRAATLEQNRQADDNRASPGGVFGLDTCKSGFVWREAFSGDHLCVAPAARRQAADDNRASASRRMQP